MLFALTAHALFASTSHFHTGLAADATARLDGAGRVAGQQDTGGAGKSGAHAQCLLCRLQRDFVSVLRHGVPQVVAPQALARRAPHATDPAVASATLLSPVGRGPPSLF
ncbi:MAG TPA: hypothetical protein VEY09_02265 [Pyrinomonadaceae bacterium]|nr:hypothetical protein [Pyrinomonadaceae bacterium]